MSEPSFKAPALPRITILAEFREFIARGNVIDLAVGVIIGAAFNDIVKVLVDQVVMPPIGLLTSGVDFSKLAIVLKPDDPATAAVNEQVAIQHGALINAGIKFLIVAWVVFLLVKAVNSLRRQTPPTEAPAAAPPPQEVLLAEIRDLLKAR